MNLPDAPIAHKGFFAAHFYTVRDQEKSRRTIRTSTLTVLSNKQEGEWLNSRVTLAAAFSRVAY